MQCEKIFEKMQNIDCYTFKPQIPNPQRNINLPLYQAKSNDLSYSELLGKFVQKYETFSTMLWLKGLQKLGLVKVYHLLKNMFLWACSLVFLFSPPN